MADLRRSLKIGDRVRVAAWPPELREDCLHADTRELYRWLIDTKSLLEVVEIDELGMPWGEIRRIVDGLEVFEKLLLNHGGLELVV